MEQRVTVPLPQELAVWVNYEASRQERPVAWVIRRCIEAARREAPAREVAA